MAVKARKKGFTLVELIVVIAIMAILAAVLIPTVSNKVQMANDETAKSEVREMLNTVRGLYATRWISIPPETITLDALVAALNESYADGIIITSGDAHKSGDKIYLISLGEYDGTDTQYADDWCVKVTFIQTTRDFKGVAYEAYYDTATNHVIVP